MEQCKITIITAVYNRAYCLENCYRSMHRQTNKNFIWMIIDDGSTDNLPELVELWKKETSEFQIVYYRKENGGKVSACNLAFQHIQTPYWTTIDSDDWLSDHAVERYYYWIDKTKDMNVAGFVGLDSAPDGKILGGVFPHEGVSRLIDIKLKIRHEGDMNMVHRTELTKQFLPMPEIKGEKDLDLYYLMLQLDSIAPLYLVNEVFCVVDYQEDGMTRNVWKAYLRSPVSMGIYRLEYLKIKDLPVSFAYRQCIHYVSSWILSRRTKVTAKMLPAPKDKPLMVLAWIPGWILSRIILLKNKG